MGIYSTDIFGENATIDQELENPNELLESFIYDELTHLSDEGKKEFALSEDARVMMEKGLISKKTIIRLNKNDDLTRRSKMAAFQAAKEKGDSLWDQLVKVRVKERELINKIVKKYGSVAQRNAKMGQRDFLKKKMSPSYMRPDLVKTKDI